ncbi:hypothetical protein GF354_01875 [Candidatus Peregrinibacteria bacterium]|nr:hypothetical protein [Candidatus Peregrinibacteria bacterium]
MKQKFLKIILYLLLAFFIIVFVKNAWMGDDAFITMRTVDNFVNGYGLRFNIAERVQSFTHPLWMMLISFFYFTTREPYYTVLAISMVLSIYVMYRFLFETSKNRYSLFLGFTILLASKAFIDYTSSGLENPLTYLFIILFCAEYFKDDKRSGSFFWLSFIAGLAMLNRLDTILLFFPALLYRFFKGENIGRKFIYGFIAILPLIFWEIFSLLYYGFPFPNTYYAKMAGTVIPLYEYLLRGVIYFWDSLTMDPITLISIALIAGMAFYEKRWKAIILILGAILYLLYVLKAGGDFMSGRFFSAPLFLCVLTFVRYFKLKKERASIFIILIALYSIVSPYSPIFSGSDYRLDRVIIWEKLDDEKGILDERAYYPGTGLLRILQGEELENYGLVERAKNYSKDDDSTRLFTVISGMQAYYAPRTIHFVDYVGLTDALVSRMSPVNPHDWRIGHIEKDFPEGYFQTLAFDENVIADEGISQFYEKMSLIVREDIFASGRIKEIFKVNTGQYDYLIGDN